MVTFAMGLESTYAATIAGGLFAIWVCIVIFSKRLFRSDGGWKYLEQTDCAAGKIKQKDYAAATRILKPLLRRRDTPSEAIRMMAVIAEMQDDWPAAQKYWRDLRRAFPSRSLGYIGEIRALLQQDRLVEAERVHKLGTKYAPNPHFIGKIFAEYYEKKQNWETAIKLWQLVRQNAPSDVESYVHGYRVLSRLGRKKDASLLLGDAKIRFPSHPQVQALGAVGHAHGGGTGSVDQ